MGACCKNQAVILLLAMDRKNVICPTVVVNFIGMPVILESLCVTRFTGKGFGCTSTKQLIVFDTASFFANLKVDIALFEKYRIGIVKLGRTFVDGLP